MVDTCALEINKLFKLLLPGPFRIPACSCLRSWSNASEMMSLANILLGTHSKKDHYSPVVTVAQGSFLWNLHNGTLRPVVR